MAKAIKQTKIYRNIRAGLLDQLERSGNDTDYFKNLVEDYMRLYITKEECAADIEERGVMFEAVGSSGQTIYKKNECIDQMLKINQQMIKILQYLGIKAVNEQDFDDEEL